jgi:hypothetical protein
MNIAATADTKVLPLGAFTVQDDAAMKLVGGP